MTPPKGNCLGPDIYCRVPDVPIRYNGWLVLVKENNVKRPSLG